jgi:uncharacterized protein YjdB
MPYLFKLSRRVARLRARTLLVGLAAALGACESPDPALSGPSLPHPSFATATGLPAGVTDLAVAATTDTSATLTFTEVDDGTGAAASYDIRVAPTPLVWGGTAPTVKRGTCTTPVAGTAIGARRTCTVLGLTTGAAYDFELVAYRGTLMVNAVFGPLSHIASATARTPVITAPGAVTDLKVAGVTDTAITLSFTEVTDGSGQPASYDVRYVSGSTLTWGGSIPSVSRGTCATPLAGTAIGAKRSCTVPGLTAATTYSFELVAYRGTLKVNAVFGDLSNIATGSTATAGAVPVASVSVAPGSATVTAGGTQQLAATLKDASGNVLTGRSVAWTSSNAAVASVAGSGLVTTIASGSATITATSGGQSGTASITVTSQPPVVTSPGTVTDLKLASATDTAATLTFTEVSDGAGKPASYDLRYVASSTMPWGGTPSVTRGTCATPVVGTTVGAKRTCTVLGLSAGTTYSFELVAYRGTLNVNAVFGGLSNVASGATTSASSGGGGSGGSGAPGGGAVLLQENFQDAGFSGRGWYDDYNLPVTTAQHMAGSTSALEIHLAPGAVYASFGTSARHAFQPTSTLYVSYWVKYSDNWVGSATPDHPHEFYILSNQDGQYAPLADDWLTTYIETNFVNGAGTPRVSLQDNLAINRSMGTTPINLIGVTEQRSVSGCNGMMETNLFSECYGSGTYNDKQFNRVGTAVFQAQSGAGYKGNWNHVEVYLQMNSIVNGVGVPDGVIQYWYNGVLAIDRHDVMFRTGARASLAFAQFVIGPYIGSGSPVDQTMWVDNLTLATRHP